MFICLSDWSQPSPCTLTISLLQQTFIFLVLLHFSLFALVYTTQGSTLTFPERTLSVGKKEYQMDYIHTLGAVKSEERSYQLRSTPKIKGWPWYKNLVLYHCRTEYVGLAILKTTADRLKLVYRCAGPDDRDQVQNTHGETKTHEVGESKRRR